MSLNVTEHILQQRGHTAGQGSSARLKVGVVAEQWCLYGFYIMYEFRVDRNNCGFGVVISIIKSIIMTEFHSVLRKIQNAMFGMSENHE